MTTPGSFAVGNVLTAGDMNELGAWLTYTPTVGNVTVSNRVGRYYIFNKIGFLYISFTFTAAPTGAVTITTPSGFTMTNTAELNERGNGILFDTSATNSYPVYLRCTAGGTSLRISWQQISGTNILLNDLSAASTPVTIANGDTFSCMWVGRVD